MTISSPTTPETAYIFYALSKLGAISNMVDPRKSAKEMEEYCLEANSNLFIVIDKVASKAKDFISNINFNLHWIFCLLLRAWFCDNNSIFKL